MLGIENGTAFRGDLGQTAYAHSQTAGNPHGTVPDLPEFATSAQTAAVGTPANMVGKITRYDTTGGAINQTLPAATAGAVFAVGWDAGTASLTLNRAGSDVIGSGSATSAVVSLVGEVITYHCTTAGRWRAVGGFKTQASLDGRFSKVTAFNIKDFGALVDGVTLTDGAMTSGQPGLVCTSGSFTSADQGKLIQVVGAGAAGAVLSTTILTVTNGTTLVLAANAAATVSAKSVTYGTNDRTAVQAAITAAQASAVTRTVYHPGGICLVGDTIQITASNLTLAGAGRHSVFQIAGPVTNHDIIAATGSQSTPIDRVTIQDLKVIGYGDDQGTTVADNGINLNWCDRSVVTRVAVQDACFTAIKITNAEGCRITDSILEQGIRGSFGGWHGIDVLNQAKGLTARGYTGGHVIANIVTYTCEHSIGVYLCDDVSVSNVAARNIVTDYAFNWTGAKRVTLDGFTVSGGGAYLYIEYDSTNGTSRICDEITVVNGVCAGLVDASVGPQIRAMHGAYLSQSTNITISGVILDCSAQSSSRGSAHGIYADPSCTGTRITGCTVIGAATSGIYIDASCDGSSVVDCTVTGTRGTGTSDAGIRMNGFNQGKIVGNRVETSAKYGIYAAHNTGIVAHNLVKSSTAAGIYILGVDMLVVHNHSSSNSTYGIQIDTAGARCRLAGNFAQSNTTANYASAATAFPTWLGINRGLNEVAGATSTRTLTALDRTLIADATSAAITLTLPAVANVQNGQTYTIKRKNSGANNVTIQGSGAETIDGANTLVLTTQYQVARLVCDGTAWWTV